MCVCVCVCVCACVCVCVNIYMCVCVSVCMGESVCVDLSLIPILGSKSTSSELVGYPTSTHSFASKDLKRSVFTSITIFLDPDLGPM